MSGENKKRTRREDQRKDGKALFFLGAPLSLLLWTLGLYLMEDFCPDGAAPVWLTRPSFIPHFILVHCMHLHLYSPVLCSL